MDQSAAVVEGGADETPRVAGRAGTLLGGGAAAGRAQALLQSHPGWAQ